MLTRREFLQGMLAAAGAPATAGSGATRRPAAANKSTGKAQQPTAQPAAGASVVTTLARFPLSGDGYSALDYSGMCCGNGLLYVFGGGHAASAMPDMFVVDDAGVRSAYRTVPRSAMAARYLSASKWWTVPDYPLQPIAAHTYSGLIWSHAIGKVIKLVANNGGPYDGGFPEAGIPDLLLGGTMGAYDPVANAWEAWDVPGIGFEACAEDTVSGNIVVLSNAMFGVLDPRSGKWIVKREWTPGHIGYDDCMAYHPGTDRFYVVTRNDWDTPGGGVPQVCEVSVERRTWTPTLTKLAYRRPGRSGKVTAGVTQYAYDPGSQMIIGELAEDIVWGFLPRDAGNRKAGWYTHRAPGAGTASFHHWAYDEKNRRHLFINTASTVGAFRPSAWEVSVPPPPEVTASINGGAFKTLADACNAGVPITISAGVLRTGAAMPKPTTLTGAGKDATRIVGGGAVLGKGALVVQADATISGISFEDVAVGDGNGAGIRQDAGKLVVNDCAFRRCQDGYLGQADVAFNRCLFEDCGEGSGQTHAVYVSKGSKLASARDCMFRGTRVGHHFKSRAERSIVSRCRMEAAQESYSCDFPWGGIIEIDHCRMTKGPQADNSVVVNVGSEVDNTLGVHSLTMSDCTLESNGVSHVVGIRIDPKIGEVPVKLTRVAFVGIETPVHGGTVTYVDCTKDGVRI